jgi:hypothetical protein
MACGTKSAHGRAGFAGKDGNEKANDVAGKKALNEAELIAGLAEGQSIRSLAFVIDCDEKTIRRRLKDPEFQAKVEAARAQLVSQAIGRTAALGSSAMDSLRDLLSAKSEAVRLGAARTIVEAMYKGRELEIHDKRLAELERRLAELEDTPHATFVVGHRATPEQIGGPQTVLDAGSTDAAAGPSARGPGGDSAHGGDDARSVANGPFTIGL